jgi:hypothetical protein
MSEDYWETEVYGAGSLAGMERVDMREIFDWLETHLPIKGAKIDWAVVQGAHSHRHFVDERRSWIVVVSSEMDLDVLDLVT